MATLALSSTPNSRNGHGCLDKGYIEIYDYPRLMATITYTEDGRKEVIQEGSTAPCSTKSQEQAVANGGKGMCQEYTKTSWTMTTIRKQWGLTYRKKNRHKSR